MGTGIARRISTTITGVAVAFAMAAPAYADNMPPACCQPPATAPAGTTPPKVIVIQPPTQTQTYTPSQPQTQTRTPSRSPSPQAPAVSGESFLDPNALAPDPAPPTQAPEMQLAPGPAGVPVTAATVPPKPSDGGGSGVPLTPIAAGLALAGGALLLAALRRPGPSCEHAQAAVAARCAELQAAQEQVRVTAQHHNSIDATLRTALAAPMTHMPDGSVAPALRPLRRERHHARDALGLAQSHAADAQRRYDEACAAVPTNCGVCPPCAAAAVVSQPMATTHA